METENNPLYVACEVCGLAFKKAGLAVHYSIHTGRRNGTDARRAIYRAEAERVALLHVHALSRTVDQPGVGRSDERRNGQSPRPPNLAPRAIA